MTPPLVKVFLVFCLLQLSERLVIASSATSADGKTEAHWTKDPLAIIETTSTPPAMRHTGTTGTRSNGKETKGQGTKVPFDIIETTHSPAVHRIGTSGTKSNGTETKDRQTKGLLDIIETTPNPPVVHRTETTGEKANGTDTKDKGSTKGPLAINETTHSPAMHRTGTPETKSEGTESKNLGTEVPLASIETTTPSPLENSKIPGTEKVGALKSSSTHEVLASATTEPYETSRPTWLPFVLMSDSLNESTTIYSSAEPCGKWNTYPGCREARYSYSTCVKCLNEYELCDNNRCNDACVEAGFYEGLCKAENQRRCPCVIRDYIACFCSLSRIP